MTLTKPIVVDLNTQFKRELAICVDNSATIGLKVFSWNGVARRVRIPMGIIEFVVHNYEFETNNI